MTARPKINLVIAPKQCERMMAKPDPHADGWCNQATHTFSIYALQEQKVYDELCKLIRRRNGRKTENLYWCAKGVLQGLYNSGVTEPMDDDYEYEPVNVREIVDHLVGELYPTDPSKAPKAE